MKIISYKKIKNFFFIADANDQKKLEIIFQTFKVDTVYLQLINMYH